MSSCCPFQQHEAFSRCCSMLGQRHWRWPNIEPALGRCLTFSGSQNNIMWVMTRISQTPRDEAGCDPDNRRKVGATLALCRVDILGVGPQMNRRLALPWGRLCTRKTNNSAGENGARFLDKSLGGRLCRVVCQAQSQTAVSAYSSSKQLPLFPFALRQKWY